MALISKPNTYSTGATILASSENANYDTIYDDYNGNILNSNCAANMALADTKLTQITTASKVSGAAITSLANVPSEAGRLPAANIALTPDVNSILLNELGSGPVTGANEGALYTKNASGDTVLYFRKQADGAEVPLVVSNSLAIGANTIDYGGGTASGSLLKDSNVKIVQGLIQIDPNSTVTITGLPFTSATSYIALTSYNVNDANLGDPTSANNDSGSQVTVVNGDGATQTVSWFCIGT